MNDCNLCRYILNDDDVSQQEIVQNGLIQDNFNLPCNDPENGNPGDL